MEKDEVNELLREDFLKTLKAIKTMYTTGKLVLSDTVMERLQFYLNEDKIMEAAGLEICYQEAKLKKR